MLLTFDAIGLEADRFGPLENFHDYTMRQLSHAVDEIPWT
jgi:hypothetical protein